MPVAARQPGQHSPNGALSWGFPRPAPGSTPLAYGDNPLLNTGKLLIALAIESDVGSPTVTQWIDGALCCRSPELSATT